MHKGCRLEDIMRIVKLHVTRNYTIPAALMVLIMDDLYMSCQVSRTKFSRHFRRLLNSIKKSDHPKALKFLNDGLTNMFRNFADSTPVQLTTSCAMVEGQLDSPDGHTVIHEQQHHLLIASTLEEEYIALIEHETPIYMLVYLPENDKSCDRFFKMLPSDATGFDAKIAVYAESLADEVEEDVILSNFFQTTLGPIKDEDKLSSVKKHNGALILQAAIITRSKD
eukprot:905346_1